jgi:hypothetical protein
LYFGANNIYIINEKISEDLHQLTKWFESNELLINLKKGKTECLLFGTSQKLKKLNEPFKVHYNNVEVVKTDTYKYLRVDLPHTLSLSSYFDKCYKKASGRLRLLHKLRNYVTTAAA